MARRDIDWDLIRAEYEAGNSQVALSKKHGVSRKAIQNHIAAEGWAQDVAPFIQRKVAEKVAGVVAGCSPEKKQAALDEAAERTAAVVTRHRDEWDDHKQLVDSAIDNQDFQQAKLAKITAETLKIRQDGERKAWGLDSGQQVSGNVNLTINSDDAGVL